MSTRCVVELYSTSDKQPSAMLYHRTDGYPGYMIEKLSNFLDYIKQYLKEQDREFWFLEATKVSALMVLFSYTSLDDYNIPKIPAGQGNLTDLGDDGVPYFEPITYIPADVQYIYKVYLAYPTIDTEIFVHGKLVYYKGERV